MITIWMVLQYDKICSDLINIRYNKIYGSVVHNLQKEMLSTIERTGAFKDFKFVL